MCLSFFFKISLSAGCQPQSSEGCERTRRIPFPLRQTHRTGLKNLALHGCQEKAVSSGPTAKVCFQLPDIPTYFLSQGKLAIHPTVSNPPSLPADPTYGHVQSLGEEPVIAASHNFMKAMGPGVGMWLGLGQGDVTGMSASLPGKTYLQYKKRGLLKKKNLCLSPSLSAWGTIV